MCCRHAYLKPVFVVLGVLFGGVRGARYSRAPGKGQGSWQMRRVDYICGKTWPKKGSNRARGRLAVVSSRGQKTSLRGNLFELVRTKMVHPRYVGVNCRRLSRASLAVACFLTTVAGKWLGSALTFSGGRARAGWGAKSECVGNCEYWCLPISPGAGRSSDRSMMLIEWRTCCWHCWFIHIIAASVAALGDALLRTLVVWIGLDRDMQ